VSFPIFETATTPGVDFGRSSYLENTSAYTIAMQIRPDDTTTTEQPVISKFKDFDDSCLSFRVRDDFFRGLIEKNTVRVIADTPSILQQGVWYDLVVTFDSGTLKVWVDGQLEASATGGPSETPAISESLVLFGGITGDFEGAVTPPLILGRSVSDSDAGFLTREMRRGFPGLLNRPSDVALLGGGGGGTTITTSLSGTATFSDTNSGTASAFGGRSDIATFSDSISVLAVASALTSDTITLSDSISSSAAGVASVAVSDTLTLTDSQAVTAVLSVNQSSTLTATEDASAVASALSQRSDTLTLSDQINVGAGVFAESVTDTITFGSTETESVTISVSDSETFTVTDSQTLSPTLTASASETLTFATTEETIATLAEVATDVLGLSDDIGDVVVIDAETGETLTFTSTTDFIVEVLTVPDNRTIVVFSESRVVVIQ
jgi:hypothetical protein